VAGEGGERGGTATEGGGGAVQWSKPPNDQTMGGFLR
jgi:hypothetical protein